MLTGRPFIDSDGELVVRGRVVCDDMWDINDANVACRMMGYSQADSAPMQINLPYSSPDFILDNVDCAGDEDDIFQCPYVPQHNCGTSEGAGVTCSGSYQQGFCQSRVWNISSHWEHNFFRSMSLWMDTFSCH